MFVREYKYLCIAIATVVSLILTQILIAWMHRLRVRRINTKSLELCTASAARDGAQPRIPITVITGFLGSGKTTLVNRILTGDHGKRIVVIENEFGAVSIDHELIDTARQKAAPNGVMVLKNGCMCCAGESPGSELERVLDQLLKMSEIEGGSMPFDYVIIETSGLADPAPIVQALWRHEMGQSRFSLDGVVALVDAKHILRHLRPSGPMGFTRRRAEAEKQIKISDRLVLNKVDLIDEKALEELKDLVRELNPSAPQLCASQAQVPLGELLDAKALSSPDWVRQLHGEGLCTPEEGAQDEAPTVTAEHGGRPVSSVLCEHTGDLELPRLQAWLQELVATRGADFYRIKAIVSIAGDDRRFVVHGVHEQVQGLFEEAWGSRPRRSTMILIGHRLDAPTLRAGFRKCCVRALAVSEAAGRAAPRG